jgi:hypothetical protein
MPILFHASAGFHTAQEVRLTSPQSFIRPIRRLE